MIEIAVRERLIDDEGVGGVLGTRIYPLVIPETALLPAVAYQRISTVRVVGHEGAVPLARVRMQLTIVADGYAAVTAVGDLIRGALHGVAWEATLGTVHSSLLDSSSDEWAETGERFIVRQDYLIMYEEN
jgi:hypothetical protein